MRAMTQRCLVLNAIVVGARAQLLLVKAKLLLLLVVVVVVVVDQLQYRRKGMGLECSGGGLMLV